MSRTTAPGPRERLLDAAQRLFYSQGASVGVDALLKEANVARRSLYEHFGGKDGLVEAVLRRASEEDLAWYEDALAGEARTQGPVARAVRPAGRARLERGLPRLSLLRDRPRLRGPAPSGACGDRRVPAAASRTPAEGARGVGPCPSRACCRAATPADRGDAGGRRHPGRAASGPGRARARGRRPRLKPQAWGPPDLRPLGVGQLGDRSIDGGLGELLLHGLEPGGGVVLTWHAPTLPATPDTWLTSR